MGKVKDTQITENIGAIVEVNYGGKVQIKGYKDYDSAVISGRFIRKFLGITSCIIVKKLDVNGYVKEEVSL